MYPCQGCLIGSKCNNSNDVNKESFIIFTKQKKWHSRGKVNIIIIYVIIQVKLCIAYRFIDFKVLLNKIIKFHFQSKTICF